MVTRDCVLYHSMSREKTQGSDLLTFSQVILTLSLLRPKLNYVYVLTESKTPSLQIILFRTTKTSLVEVNQAIFACLLDKIFSCSYR